MKLILTKELGRLTKWLRILGFDAEYSRQDNISSLVIEALRDGRIVLTRNHRLPKCRGIKMIFVRSEKIKAQLKEALKALNFQLNSAMMFSRCTLCNTVLIPAEKEPLKDKIPDYVFRTQDKFMSCPKCLRVYWEGTHWGKVADTLKEINI